MKKIGFILCAMILAACAPKAAQSSTEASAQPAASGTVAAPVAQPAANAALLAPELATATAPAVFQAKFITTKGDFTVEVHRDWAPNGADRFYNLVKIGYFYNIAFFRDIAGFMVQFGIHGSPDVNAKWHNANIPDDPASQSNKRGFVTFATAGPNTRTTQLFVNFGDNGMLDSQGFAPFGQVVSGMDIVDGLYNGYGEGAPQGRGPDQGRLQGEGNAYLAKDFPLLDYVKTARLVK